MAYEGFTDLTRRKVSDKISRDDGFNIAKVQNIMDIKEVLLQLLVNFLIKSFLAAVLKIRIFQTRN